MSTVKQPAKVIAYLLRCWMEGSSWRYSLEEVGTGKTYGFATLDEFVSFMVVRSTPPDEQDKPALEFDLKEGEPRARLVTKSSSGDER